MREYQVIVNLHLRNYRLPVHITVEERRPTSDNKKVERILEFLLKQDRIYWDETNMEKLNQLSFYKTPVFARIQEPFWHLFRTGDYNHVRQFMEHDMFQVPLFKDYFLLPEEERDGHGFLNLTNRQREPKVLLQFHKFRDLRRSSSFRRLRKTLCGIEAIRKETFGAHPFQKVRCLKMIFKYIREPYITSAEVRNMVKDLGGENLSEELLQKISKLFESYFPESSRPYQPRSLKHLSCCSVRENLRAAGTYPQAVKSLHIPKDLKPYILLDYLPWVPENSSSYITFNLSDVTEGSNLGVEFGISN